MKYMRVFLSHTRALSSSPISFSSIALLCRSTLRTPVIRVNWKSSPITPSLGFQFLPFASSSKFHFFQEFFLIHSWVPPSGRRTVSRYSLESSISCIS